MDPNFLTAVERDPVRSLEALLEATDPDASERVRLSCRTLINNKPSSRLAARTAALNLGRYPTMRRKAIADETGVGAPAVSQTILRLQRELDDREPHLREHALISYIREQVGTIALVSELPAWVQRIVTVEPSTNDEDWGTPNDLAQFVTAIALRSSRFVAEVPGRNSPHEGRWWITPERSDLVETVASLAEQIAGEASRAMSRADLQRELARCGVVDNHHAPVLEAMASSRRLLWVPSGHCYVAFARRSPRGNAPQRAKDVLALLPHLDQDLMEDELVTEFETQHGLKRDSAIAAVRSARNPGR